MTDLKDLKGLEDKIKALEDGKMSGEEAAALIEDCVRESAAQGG